jgi:hypothetical protein
MKLKVVYIPLGDTAGFPRRHWEICTDEEQPCNIICFDGDAKLIRKMVKLWNDNLTKGEG